MFHNQPRSEQPEFIDLGPNFYTHEEYEDCLYQLSRVGRLLGGDRATLQTFKQLSFTPTSILDVGCGSGLFTKRLGLLYPQASIVGTDLSTVAIAYARKHSFLPNIHYEIPLKPELDYPDHAFDIVTSTLVCHHLNDYQLIDFIKRACRVAKKRVIFNDLHRHLFAQWSFSIIAPVLFRNRLISHDGLLSIKKAFTKQDMHILLEKAGISKKAYTLTWHFAFRWILTINTEKIGSI